MLRKQEHEKMRVLSLLDRSRLQKIVGFQNVLENRLSTIQREMETIQRELSKKRTEHDQILQTIESTRNEDNVDAAEKKKKIDNLRKMSKNREKKIETCSERMGLMEKLLAECEMAIFAVKKAADVFSLFSDEYELNRKAVCEELDSIILGVTGEDIEITSIADEADLSLLAKCFLYQEGKKRAEIMERIEKRLFDHEVQTDSVSEFYGVLLDQMTEDNSAAEQYALQLISRLEEELASAKKRAERAERKLAQVSENIYGTCYRPIEALETLASNLRCFDKAISPQMICAKLNSPLVELRKGLNSMGVLPAVSIDEWEKGQIVPYDQTRHEAETPLSDLNVLLRTMGFVYQDKWGEECTHPAKVINKNIELKNKKAEHGKEPQSSLQRKYLEKRTAQGKSAKRVSSRIGSTKR